jgi:hypothetical protein
MPFPDPLEFGPTPLLKESQRAAVDKLIDGLEANLRHEITTRIPAGADSLFRRGYRPNELRVCGFGNEIEVEPIRKLPWFRLFVRRVLMKLRILENPSGRNYSNLTIQAYDTYRLIKGLDLYPDPQLEVENYDPD